MKPVTYSDRILTVIAVLLLLRCLQGFGIIGTSRVELYHDGEAIGEGHRPMRGNPLPVQVVNQNPF